jgi:ABC-2 type transport system permease protein
MSVFHGSGISAVARRQLHSLLANPLGYVFIFAFVVIAGAFLFLPDSYYTRNIADLGPLFGVMPWLLVILLPALAMGAWAQERELGTEELLLTLPLGIVDAILGKFLAVVGYFTLALLCSLSNLVVLGWLGSPDIGLVFANYVGWWLAGVAFAGFGVLASVQVGMPAIAFVVGVLYCGILMVGGNMVEWFDPFNRGVIPFGGVVIALVAAFGSLGVAVFMLSSRRWRPTNTQQIASHVASVALGLILAVNLGRLAYLENVDSDVSSEGLSSISATSAGIISKVPQPVTIVAFISAQLPEDLRLKAKEVTDKLFAVERSSGGKVTVELHHPDNPLDEHGQRATKEFGLKPFRAIVDSVSGRKPQDVFLSAAVVSGSRSQIIPAFDPGLSVEYELVRAVRAVSATKKPVVGIGSTDLKMTADFDFQTGQMRQAWELVEELKKQYEVREVNFDVEVPAEVEVLLVPLPSSLTQPQVEKLHDYIWAGRPALILEDPLPMFSNPQLAPSQPKRAGGNPMMQQQAPEQKADMAPFYRALGLDFNLSTIVWSDFNPGHQFRGMMPPAFVWLMRDQQSVESSPITTGIDSVLLPFPGAIMVADGKPESLTVKPLLLPSATTKWGRHQFGDYFTQGFMGMQQSQPKRFLPGDPSRRPALAVEVTGVMPSAYPRRDPAAKPAEAKTAEAKPGEEPAKPAEPELKPGVPSAKPVRVIVVADTDFAINQIFEIYRNAGDQMSRDELAVLRNLRNVQFIANAVDALAADQDFLALRSRRPQARPLSRIQDVMVKTDAVRREQLESATMTAENAIAKAQDDYRKATEKVEAQVDLDANAKEQLKADIERDANRKLQKTLATIEYDKDVASRNAEIIQDQTIDQHLLRVKWFAVGIPGFVMLILVLGIASLRLRSERSHIPASRKRSQP